MTIVPILQRRKLRLREESDLPKVTEPGSEEPSWHQKLGLPDGKLLSTLPPGAPLAFLPPPTYAVGLDSAQLCSRRLGAPVRHEACQSPAVCRGPPGSSAQGVGQGGVSPSPQSASHPPALLTKEQTGVMAQWQPRVPFDGPEGWM